MNCFSMLDRMCYFSSLFRILLWKQLLSKSFVWNLRQPLGLLDLPGVFWQTAKKCFFPQFLTQTYFEAAPFSAIFTNFSPYHAYFYLVWVKKTCLQIQEGCCLQFWDVSVLILEGRFLFVKSKGGSFFETSGGFKLVLSQFLWNFCGFTDKWLILVVFFFLWPGFMDPK